MNSTRSFHFLLVFFSLFVASTLADGLSDAVGRMRARVPAIDALKQSEAIGENNRGFLEVRKEMAEATQTVTEENSDRQTVFTETARKSGSSAEAVGKAFSRQLAGASAPGVWLQKEDGSWYKK